MRYDALTEQILALRTQSLAAAPDGPSKVLPDRANAVFREQEPDGRGGLVATTTLLLAAAQCPLRCAMCDLWQHTLPGPTPPGAIVAQIHAALAEQPVLPRRGTIKLYNSGSFFDPHSVPPADYGAIAAAVRGFDRVVVENHPRFGRSRIAGFAELLEAPLEIAVGLESIQPGMLRRLNKKMTRDDFDRFANQLQQSGIGLRVFLMLRPPWTLEQEAIRWTLLSVRHALAAEARHITIIPARAGNGWMDHQQSQGMFESPRLSSLRAVLEASQDEVRRRAANCVVTADLWDVDPRLDPPEYQAIEELNAKGR